MIKTAIRVNINEADAELVTELPGPLLRIRMRLANEFAVRASFVTGNVLNAGGIALSRSEWFDSGEMYKGPGPLYFAAEEPGAAFQLELWTSSTTAITVAEFGFGFDLGYSS